MFELFESSTFQLRGFFAEQYAGHASLGVRGFSGLRLRNRHSCTRSSAETRAMTRGHSGLSGVMGRFFIAHRKTQTLLVQPYHCSPVFV